MKNFRIISTAALFAALSFTGCENNSKNGGSLTINAKVEDGNSINNFVDEVYAIDYSQEIIIASAPYKNGGFKITLPEKIDERLLFQITDYFEEEIDGGVKVSNKYASITNINHFAGYKNNEDVFAFYLEGGNSEKHVTVFYFYVDTDVQIIGAFEPEWWFQPIKYNMNLKKGWNTVYYIYKGGGIDTRTTQKPDIDLKWCYY